MRLKNHIYGVFLSESFAGRPYIDQSAVLHAFEGWIKGTNSIDSMTVWRMLNLELWLQEFFDEHDPADDEPARSRRTTSPTPASSSTSPRRRLGRASLSAAHRPVRPRGRPRGQDPRLRRALLRGPTRGRLDHAAATGGRWFFFISEKIVAITQGRSFFIWDINVEPSRRAS